MCKSAAANTISVQSFLIMWRLDYRGMYIINNKKDQNIVLTVDGKSQAHPGRALNKFM